MNKLEFIKKSLEHDLDYWKKQKEENDMESMRGYYNGTVASLEAFYQKIKLVFEEKEKQTND